MKIKPLFSPVNLCLACSLLMGCTFPSAPDPVKSGTALAPVTGDPTTDTAVVSNEPKDTGRESRVLSSGSLVSGEHPTSGRVRIVRQGKERVLELGEDFKTSDTGPDLVVILHRSPDVIGSTVPPAYPIKEGDYVLLASLKRFSGAQSYTIPTGIDLADYRSAAIWCRKFNATFGAARLN
jgi:Electron transfer DM13